MTPVRPPADPDAPAVEVQDLSVVLGSSLILSGIDLRIEPGESVALLGANGSGKSTLVRTILGLLPIRTGTVRLFGHNVARRSAVPWRRVGYVPQRVGAAAGVPATALEVVRSGLLDPRRPLADRGRRARERALKALEAVGLAERADDHVQVFSGGQSQRVLIARALVRSPELLILDEPFSGLDPVAVDVMSEVLRERAEAGVPTLFSSHQLDIVEHLCDRVAIVRSGRLVAEGTTESLQAGAEPRWRVVIDVAGSPRRRAGGGPGRARRRAQLDVSGAPSETGTRLTLVAGGPDEQRLLRAAENLGRLRELGPVRRPLAEVFREALAAPADLTITTEQEA